MPSLSFEKFLTTHVGAFGPWQWVLFLLLTVATNPPVIQFPQLATLVPPHSCSGTRANTSLAVNDTWALCRVLRPADEANCAACAAAVDNGSALQSCTQWHYVDAQAQFKHSLSQEFDLVCHRRILIPTSSMLFMAGMSIGYASGGVLGDSFGRCKTSFVSGIITFFLSIGVAFSINIWMFAALRFLLAIAYSCSILNSHVYCNEITDERHRNIYSFIFHFNNDVIANLFAVLSAFLLQDWRLYHLAISAPLLLTALFPCIVPESPRWLFFVGRYAEARQILVQAAKRNGKKLSVAEFNELEILRRTKNSTEKTTTYWKQIFANRHLFPVTTVLSIMWLAIGINYFGLWFFAVRSKGNPYIIAFVTCAMGFPISLVKSLLFHFFSRKWCIFGTFCTGTLLTITALLLTIFAPHHIAITVIVTLALGATAGTYLMTFNISPEHFPTELRGAAMGFLMFVSRIGSIIGVLVERTDEIWNPLAPIAIFVVIFSMATVASLFLPKGIMSSEEKTIIEARADNNETIL